VRAVSDRRGGVAAVQVLVGVGAAGPVLVVCGGVDGRPRLPLEAEGLTHGDVVARCRDRRDPDVRELDRLVGGQHEQAVVGGPGHGVTPAACRASDLATARIVGRGVLHLPTDRGNDRGDEVRAILGETVLIRADHARIADVREHIDEVDVLPGDVALVLHVELPRHGATRLRLAEDAEAGVEVALHELLRVESGDGRHRHGGRLHALAVAVVERATGAGAHLRGVGVVARRDDPQRTERSGERLVGDRARVARGQRAGVVELEPSAEAHRAVVQRVERPVRAADAAGLEDELGRQAVVHDRVDQIARGVGVVADGDDVVGRFAGVERGWRDVLGEAGVGLCALHQHRGTRGARGRGIVGDHTVDIAGGGGVGAVLVWRVRHHVVDRADHLLTGCSERTVDLPAPQPTHVAIRVKTGCSGHVGGAVQADHRGDVGPRAPVDRALHRAGHTTRPGAAVDRAQCEGQRQRAIGERDGIQDRIRVVGEAEVERDGVAILDEVVAVRVLRLGEDHLWSDERRGDRHRTQGLTRALAIGAGTGGCVGLGGIAHVRGVGGRVPNGHGLAEAGAAVELRQRIARVVRPGDQVVGAIGHHVTVVDARVGGAHELGTLGQGVDDGVGGPQCRTRRAGASGDRIGHVAVHSGGRGTRLGEHPVRWSRLDGGGGRRRRVGHSVQRDGGLVGQHLRAGGKRPQGQPNRDRDDARGTGHVVGVGRGHDEVTTPRKRGGGGFGRVGHELHRRTVPVTARSGQRRKAGTDEHGLDGVAVHVEQIGQRVAEGCALARVALPRARARVVDRVDERVAGCGSGLVDHLVAQFGDACRRRDPCRNRRNHHCSCQQHPGKHAEDGAPAT